jgi:hypothetical protein
VKLKAWFSGACVNCWRQGKGFDCKVRDRDKSDIKEGEEIEKEEYTTRSGRSIEAPKTYKSPDTRKTRG